MTAPTPSGERAPVPLVREAVSVTHPFGEKSQATAPLNPSVCILEAKGITKSFGRQTVLRDVDIILNRGEVVLLRGENGSGKTTLLNILTGNLEPDSGSIKYLADDSPRTYSFPRRWWQELNPWDHFRPEFVAKEGIGRTWQDIRLFGHLTLRDNIAVAEPGQHGENPVMALFAPGRVSKSEQRIRAEADAMIVRLGLAGREESSADKVSLGQSKRVSIARAVAAGARILFLDEPLAGLDRQGVDDILSLLDSLAREQDLTLVIVEHVFHHHHLTPIVTTDWMLDKGRIQQSDGSNPNLHAPSSSSCLSSPSESHFYPSWFSLLAGDDAEIIDEPLPRGAMLTRIRRPGRWKPDAKPVLEISNLIVKRGRRTVIGLDDDRNESGFNLTLHDGEIAILQAPNGWGKSTLFRAICGQLPASGQIRLRAKDLRSLAPWDRVKAGLTALPSDESAFPSLSMDDTTRLSGSKAEIPASDSHLAARTMASLSGGERQRTLLRLAAQPSVRKDLALYDEPFAMLDNNAASRATAQMLSGHIETAILCLIPSGQSPSKYQENLS